MSTFTDAAGQEWRLEFDGFLLDRVATEAKVDLADMSAEGLLSIERDVKALVRVLAVACGEQLKERGKSASEFQKQIRKDAITRAREAMLDALADFFPESEWSAMQSNLTTRKNQPEMTPQEMQLAASFLSMDSEVQKDVLGMIQQEMADGNLASLSDGESVSGPAATPPTPAENLPENAESAPGGSPSGISG